MKDKLKELIDAGADIEFNFNGKDYTILAWIDEGISVGEKNKNDDNVFKDFDDLRNNYIIDGQVFGSVLDDIKLTFTSGC